MDLYKPRPKNSVLSRQEPGNSPSPSFVCPVHSTLKSSFPRAAPSDSLGQLYPCSQEAYLRLLSRHNFQGASIDLARGFVGETKRIQRSSDVRKRSRRIVVVVVTFRVRQRRMKDRRTALSSHRCALRLGHGTLKGRHATRMHGRALGWRCSWT
jgi:hypothetical protein